MKENTHLFLKLDWPTVGLYLLLVAIGWISVYAAAYNEEHSTIFDFSQRYGKQFVWILSALLIAAFILLLDSKFYSVFGYAIYGVVLFLLLLVLVAGTEINGSRSWFILGPVRLQPAELAKAATAIALARMMSVHGFVLARRANLCRIALVILLPAGLIILQHDAGSAVVFGAFLLMLYREGLSGWFINIVLFAIVAFVLSIVWEPVSVLMLCATISVVIYMLYRRKIKRALILTASLFGVYFSIVKWLFPTFAIDVAPDRVFILLSAIALVWGAATAIRYKRRYVWYILCFFIGSAALVYSVDYVFDHLLKPHQRDRIENLLGVKVDLRGAGYNVHQSKVAIGSGGFAGKGFLQGTQTKYNFVPEQSTDFIFCTIGEEWGLLGASAVIIAYLLLLFRLILISERQKDAFARIYGYGVIAILFFHVVINIGMTIGLAPVIGIPLPFISYGGSSLWAFTVLLFILLKLDMARWR
ncbi:MAG: rod shape-determining protein RodA [Prevotellaceae bacterium]|jgi:rod shape determining protein RodA|nr:rod shape-determining protein RodA [Prevotellaceae bacterium]